MRFFRKRKKRIILRPFGQVYNLREIFHEINQEYFNAKLSLHITWFGRGEQIPKTRITFGAYNKELKLIKINRLLDKQHIPVDFVRYIVYHEMLHDAFPPKRKKRGTHHIHHSEFKEREKDFAEYALAQSFLKTWRNHYNAEGPHSNLGVLMPK